jgi:hypothetical protein
MLRSMEVLESIQGTDIYSIAESREALVNPGREERPIHYIFDSFELM